MPSDAGTGHGPWMRMALGLAQRGEGQTRPNPPVGAVVVRNDRVVGAGWHRRAGGPHAEVFALRQAGPLARGATLYVTLEPCSTQGRTPPCTDLILASGVREVVVGVRDPNPAHAGRGLRLLRRAGVAVTAGVERTVAAALIAPFAAWVRTGRPRLTLKLAVTLDGRIADASGASRWITGARARARVQALRRASDVVVVGAGTVVADDPSLLCRRGGSALRRLVVDATGQVPVTARLFTDGRAGRTIVATTARCPAGRRAAYARLGAAVWVLPETESGRVALPALCARMGQEGFLHALCEGGAALAGALVADGLVDEYLFFVAPALLGAGGARPALADVAWPLSEMPRLAFAGIEAVGDDALLRAVPRAAKGGGACSRA